MTEQRKLRICIDLDGTICDIRKDGETYADVRAKPGAAEKIRALRAAGHTVIINTARNMGSTGHNVGKALKNVGKMTFEWLEKNGIEYDEIFSASPMRTSRLTTGRCGLPTTGRRFPKIC